MKEQKTKASPPQLTLYTLALNYLPFSFILLGSYLVFETEGVSSKVFISLVWIYLLPPFFSRMIIMIWGNPSGRGLTQQDQAYKVWWLLSQLQMIFNRLPFLEELLRLIPGLYALWLGIWGAKVSPFSFWAPGSRIMDRHAVIVGPGVVIGAQATLSSHLGTVDKEGTYRIDIAAVEIQNGAIVGGKAGIGPGCMIYSNAQLPAGRLLKPYTSWPRGGQGE